MYIYILHIYIYTCIYIYTSIYIHVYIYIYMCIYIYIIGLPDDCRMSYVQLTLSRKGTHFGSNTAAGPVSCRVSTRNSHLPRDCRVRVG